MTVANWHMLLPTQSIFSPDRHRWRHFLKITSVEAIAICPVDGDFPVSDTPGMGVTIDEDAVRSYAI
jgi:L-alanine-DL-glutamate epimerase-like enolase superfamily enzyme